jgi:hypothetical protein
MMLGLNWLFAILLIVTGALAAYSGIVRTWPNFRQGLDRIMPYKEWVAIPALIWGIWNLLRILAHLGMMTMLPAVWLIILLLANAAAVVLGFILSYEWIAQYLLTNVPNARRRGEEWRSKLLPRQVAVGWAGIVLGALLLLLPALM